MNDIPQQRGLHQRLARSNLARHHSGQDGRRQRAPLLGIDMRVLLVGDQDIGEFDGRGRNVGVKIVRDHQRYVSPYCGAHPAHDFLIRVRKLFGKHGAVQSQQDSVQILV